MFETILSELQAARASAGEGKYFSAASHGGKALTAAGDLGAKFFETNAVVTFGAGEWDEAKIAACEAECRRLATFGGPDAVNAGWQDWFNTFLPIILEIIRKIRELKDK